MVTVLETPESEVAPEEQIADGGWRKEGSRLVLILRVEDLAEVKTGQRNCWQSRNRCSRETTKEVGVDKTAILGCFEEQRPRLTTQRKAFPL